jgi:hypothetical protein
MQQKKRTDGKMKHIEKKELSGNAKHEAQNSNYYTSARPVALSPWNLAKTHL